ncbi:unnamed protein product [Lepeophtheirus salmonis]|uniref:(salmon louse) hypothetical protein n=1 Tax=Lepeophtheirus salmonis TaxID=72036 RepID=A0A7R8CKV8_LEPSM|nr:unnamed protein product [Lepeophtheirus salmonis]CAF2851785.1 unnamed protein product [Lepeophtheirus salmonis]
MPKWSEVVYHKIRNSYFSIISDLEVSLESGNLDLQDLQESNFLLRTKYQRVVNDQMSSEIAEQKYVAILDAHDEVEREFSKLSRRHRSINRVKLSEEADDKKKEQKDAMRRIKGITELEIKVGTLGC